MMTQMKYGTINLAEILAQFVARHSYKSIIYRVQGGKNCSY